MNNKNKILILFANLLSLMILVIGSLTMPITSIFAIAAENDPKPLLKVENKDDGDISKGEQIVSGNDYIVKLSSESDQTLYLPASKDFAVNLTTYDKDGNAKRSGLPDVEEQAFLSNYAQRIDSQKQSTFSSSTIDEAAKATTSTTTNAEASSNQESVEPVALQTDAFKISDKYYIIQIKKDDQISLEFIRQGEPKQKIEVFDFAEYLKNQDTDKKQTLFTFKSIADVKADADKLAKEQAEIKEAEDKKAEEDKKAAEAKQAEAAKKAAAAKDSAETQKAAPRVARSVNSQVLATNGAAGINLTNVDITVNGQTLQPGGTAQITGSQIFPNASHLVGEFVGDGKTTIYDIPIHITNVGKDSIGAFGPLENAGDVYDAITGEKVGQIKQTGDWDKPNIGEYTGRYFIQLDKPLTGNTKFDVALSGAGNINAKSSQTPFVITINNQFTYKVNPEARDLSEEAFGKNGVGQYGIDGNQGYVYIGSNTYNTSLQNILLDAVNRAKDNKFLFPTNKDYNSYENSYKDEPAILGSSGSGNDLRKVIPQTNLIVTQRISIDTSDPEDAGTKIKDIVVGNQGTHTWRISDGTKTTDPKLYMLTKDGNPDINQGIESSAPPIEIPSPGDNLSGANLAVFLNTTNLLTAKQRTEGNYYVKSKMSDGSYTIAFNYGNFARRTGFTTSDYFGNKLGTKSDEVQEVNRTTDVNKKIDDLLRKDASKPLRIGDGWAYSTPDSNIAFIYNGQTFDNYVNLKVILENNVYAKVKSEMGAYVLATNGNTYELNNDSQGYYKDSFDGKDRPGGNHSGFGVMPPEAKVTYATNRPTNGILNGQTVVNVYYVTKDGKEVLPSKRFIGWPGQTKIGNPDPPFTVTAPRSTPYSGQTLTLYDKDDADGYLNPRYGVNGRHLLHAGETGNPVSDTLMYPDGPTGTEANYYYVYDSGSAPYAFKKYKKDSNDSLAGAQFVLSSYPAGANSARDLSNQINAEEAKGDQKDKAKIAGLWKKMSRYVVRSYENTAWNANSDNYGEVWNRIKDTILNQLRDPDTGAIIFTKYKYDLNEDGKVDDTDKNLWLDDYSLILKSTSASNGVVSFGNLDLEKTYYLIEIKAPNGYSLTNPADYNTLPGDTQYRFWLGANEQLPNPATFRVDNPPAGYVEITKTDHDDASKKLAGAQFVFTWSAENAANLQAKFAQRATALAAGDKATVEQIESDISGQVLRNYTDTSFGLNSTNWSTVWDKIKNDKDASGKYLYDFDQNGSVDDTDKGLWSHDFSKVTIATTDENGLAKVNSIDMEGKDSRTIYAVEMTPPDGYAFPAKEEYRLDKYKIVISKDSKTQVFTGKTTIDNDYGQLKITKVDADDDKKKLANAKFVFTWDLDTAKDLQDKAAELNAAVLANNQTKIDELQAYLSQRTLRDYTNTSAGLNSTNWSDIWNIIKNDKDSSGALVNDYNKDGQINNDDQALWIKDYSKVAVAKTGSDGVASFGKIDMEGKENRTLYPVEIQAPDGYSLLKSTDLTEAMAIKIQFNKDLDKPLYIGETTIKNDNDRPTGKLKFKKVDDKGNPIANVPFYVTSLPSWANEVQDLIRQINTIKANPTDDKTADNAAIANLQGEISKRVVRKYQDTAYGMNSDNYDAVWQKISKDSKVDGKDYNAWLQDASLIYTATSGKDGYVTFDNLEVGNGKDYYLIEADTPDGYMKPQLDYNNLGKDQQNYKVHVTTTDQNPAVNDATIVNTPATTINIEKVDKTDHTTKLTGAMFVLTDTKEHATSLVQLIEKIRPLIYTTDPSSREEDQKVFNDLQREIAKLSLKKYLNDFDRPNSFSYDKDFWQTIKKDMNDDGKVDDADYNVLIDKLYNYYVTAVTDDKGQASFANFDASSDSDQDGKFYVVEMLPPAGYAADSTITEATVADGGTAKVTIENVKSKITIDKLSATDKSKLTGAEFKLYDASGNEVTIDSAGAPIGNLTTTDKDGKYQTITIDNLPLGDYKLVETKAPAGHELLKKEFMIHLTKDQSIIHYDISDVPQVELPFTGSDNIWQVTLAVLASSLVIALGMYTYSRKKGGGVSNESSK